MIRSFIAIAALTVCCLPASAQVYVNGYTRSNGTYVNGHYRTSPDGIKSNNYSYSPSFGGSSSGGMRWDSNGMYRPNY